MSTCSNRNRAQKIVSKNGLTSNKENLGVLQKMNLGSAQLEEDSGGESIKRRREKTLSSGAKVAYVGDEPQKGVPN